MAISSVAEGQTQSLEGGQGVKWIPDEGQVPENAIRVRVGKGFPLCRGPFAEDEDRKDYWRDMGVRKQDGRCHSLRVRKELKFQENFFYLVPDMEAAEARVEEAVAGATQGMISEIDVREQIMEHRMAAINSVVDYLRPLDLAKMNRVRRCAAMLPDNRQMEQCLKSSGILR